MNSWRQNDYDRTSLDQSKSCDDFFFFINTVHSKIANK